MSQCLQCDGHCAKCLHSSCFLFLKMVFQIYGKTPKHVQLSLIPLALVLFKPFSVSFLPHSFPRKVQGHQGLHITMPVCAHLLYFPLWHLLQLVTLEPVAATTTPYPIHHQPTLSFSVSPFLVGKTFQQAVGSLPWISGWGVLNPHPTLLNTQTSLQVIAPFHTIVHHCFGKVKSCLYKPSPAPCLTGEKPEPHGHTTS